MDDYSWVDDLDAVDLRELSNLYRIAPLEPVPGPPGTGSNRVRRGSRGLAGPGSRTGSACCLKLHRTDPTLDPHETFDVTLGERLADPRVAFLRARAVWPGLGARGQRP